jgi:hypothetical protein
MEGECSEGVWVRGGRGEPLVRERGIKKSREEV